MIAFYTQAVRIPALLVVLAVLALGLGTDVFLDVNNLDSLQTLLGPIVITVTGMTLLFVIGQFDLSVGAVMGLSGIVAALALDAGSGVPVACTLALCSGVAVGAVNGWLVAWLGINPLIATLAMLAIVRGIIEWLVQGMGVAGFTSMPEAFTTFGNATPFGVYTVVWIALAILAATEFGLARVPFMRRLYYIGGNANAARLLGQPVRLATWAVFVAAGMLAALAGLLVTARVGMANRYLGAGAEMDAIIACLIGGAVLRGGRGSVVCAALGATFMALLKNGFNITEVAPEWQGVVLGAILVAVVVVDGGVALRQRRLGL